MPSHAAAQGCHLPTVQLLPIEVGAPFATWMLALSWMLVLSPTEMLLASPARHARECRKQHEHGAAMR